MFPLFVRAIGVIASIVGILAVTPRSETEHGMKAINRGFLSAAISAGGVFVISRSTSTTGSLPRRSRSDSCSPA